MLPQSVRDMGELPPIEDVLLAFLRPALPDVEVKTLVPDAMAADFPFVVARRQYNMMHWRGDLRAFVDQAYIQVDTFTQDTTTSSGDEEGAILSEAVRVALRDAWLDQTVIEVEGKRVAIAKFDLLNAPRRAGDWANATGPVQYADLPAGAWRYTTVYRITFRYQQ